MSTVFSLETVITKEQCFQHLKFPFILEKDYSRLVIEYSYFPKDFLVDGYHLAYAAFKEAYGDVEVMKEDVLQELPLKNHVTLSVLREGIIMGTAHRHPNEMQITLGKDSTEGFHSFKPNNGNYALVLSTHAVLTDSVNVFLKVDAYE